MKTMGQGPSGTQAENIQRPAEVPPLMSLKPMESLAVGIKRPYPAQIPYNPPAKFMAQETHGFFNSIPARPLPVTEQEKAALPTSESPKIIPFFCQHCGKKNLVSS
jgi:hypothetical protein